jgi:ubiquinone/menaquinone biosynthesis C-methylase UbiE
MERRSDDDAVIDGFGREWETFTHGDAAGEADLRRAFDDYFHIFPWEALPPNAVGADVGCGTGRWACFVAPRVGKLYCVDPSDALEVARRALAGNANCEFIRARADQIPLPDSSLDFAYCLGVLHHVSNTEESLRAIAAKLRPGAPFLLYLYYALETRPWWYRAIWRVADIPRRIVSRAPFALRLAASNAIAALVYWPLARLARVMERLGGDPEKIPLATYRAKRFYFMRADALDRFGTRVEKRFTRAQIEKMMRAAGLDDIRFSERMPYWTALGRRTQDSGLRT